MFTEKKSVILCHLERMSETAWSRISFLHWATKKKME